MCIFAFQKYRVMKNYITAVVLSALLFTSCANEFNRVYKTNDYSYKYEYAKECYAQGKYTRASTLLQGLVTLQKGTDNAQESLYMLGMAEYNSKDYEGAAATFKK
jgi:outer membrane protein assembly factor BamD